MKSVDGFLGSHKTMVEPGRRGSQVMSGDWRRLHQVRRVCGGSPKNHRVTRLSHKAEAKTGRGCLAETGLTGLGLQGAGSFEAKGMHRDRKA
jgi:hypothetical protein